LMTRQLISLFTAIVLCSVRFSVSFNMLLLVKELSPIRSEG
jgi:hypothetical protein